MTLVASPGISAKRFVVLIETRVKKGGSKRYEQPNLCFRKTATDP